MARLPTCPRCGYDQSGVIDTWQSARTCPLRGVCSECGLIFRWADVFRPELNWVRGFFEHAKTPRRELVALFMTLWWTMRPWVFWSRVTVFVPPSPRRAIVWLSLATVIPLLLGSAIGCAGWVLAESIWGRGLMSIEWDALIAHGTSPVCLVERQLPWLGPYIYWDPERWFHTLGWLLIPSLTPVVLLLCLRDTRRVHRVRWPHVFRAGVYSLAWIPALAVARCLIEVILIKDSVTFAQLAPAPGTARIIPFYLPTLAKPVRESTVLAFAAAVPAWLAVWWWFAVSRGFAIGQSRGTWAILIAGAALATVAALTSQVR